MDLDDSFAAFASLIPVGMTRTVVSEEPRNSQWVDEASRPDGSEIPRYAPFRMNSFSEL